MRIVMPADRPKHIRDLPDGLELTLSPILKIDRELLAKGVQELSLESKFSRFGQGVAGLTAHELDYLSDVDQKTHVAWGAAIGEEVAGVGRYIVTDDGERAEVAITVLDEMQRKGVGRALFEALAAVGRSDGIREFYFEAQADNDAVVGLMREIAIAPFSAEGLIEQSLRLADLPTSTDDEDLVRVIREVRAETPID